MRTILSSSNPRIKRIKQLNKSRKQSRFLIEGKKLLQEALEARVQLEEIYMTAEVSLKERTWIRELETQGMQLMQVTSSVFKSISDVQTPQGILGVARRPVHAQASSLSSLALLLISIRDPGNLGAIVRTAEACGCEWVACSQDCADPFQPKVIRSAMGSLFRVPVLEIEEPIAFLREQAKKKVATCGLDARGGTRLTDWKPGFPLILCIGSESHGLSPDLPLTQRVAIPMKGSVESLNAAVAAAVCLYWIRFQQESFRT